MPISFPSRPALVAYITCGDPDLATTREIILAAIAPAPTYRTRRPLPTLVADGPVIQRASERALKHNTSLDQVLDLARDIRQQVAKSA